MQEFWSCKVSRSLWIRLSEDRRVFTSVARNSYLWKSLYRKRTAVERVNGRLDTDFGFEDHYIRGQRKMEPGVGLSLIVMLAMAVGRIKQKRPELMRSLIGDAAGRNLKRESGNHGAASEKPVHRCVCELNRMWQTVQNPS